MKYKTNLNEIVFHTNKLHKQFNNLLKPNPVTMHNETMLLEMYQILTFSGNTIIEISNHSFHTCLVNIHNLAVKMRFGL